MKTTAFLAIKFRSESHKDWFITTMILFCGNMIGTLICLWSNIYVYPIGTSAILCFLSFSTSYAAIRKTKRGAIDNELWSSDCIWYNALLATIYFLLATVLVVTKTNLLSTM